MSGWQAERRRYEASRRVTGDYGYRYPARYLGPARRSQPIPAPALVPDRECADTLADPRAAHVDATIDARRLVEQAIAAAEMFTHARARALAAVNPIGAEIDGWTVRAAAYDGDQADVARVSLGLPKTGILLRRSGDAPTAGARHAPTGPP